MSEEQIPVLTSLEARQLDDYLIHDPSGPCIPHETLMREAGHLCSQAIIESVERRYSDDFSGLNAIVLTGSGGNGGDGLVVAADLAARGFQEVDIYVPTPSEDDLWMKLATEAGAAGCAFTDSVVDWGQYDVAIDALTGFGFNVQPSEIREPLRSVLEDSAYEITGCSNHLLVVAIDCPSGVAVDSTVFPAVRFGEDGFSPVAILPDVLVSIGAAKHSGIAAERRAAADGRAFTHYLAQGLIPERILRERGLYFSSATAAGVAMVSHLNGKETRL